MSESSTFPRHGEAERWLPVVGWETLYEVSNRGLVRSFDRMVPNRWGGLTPRKGCLIAPWPDRHGYLMVYLYRDGKGTKRFVHQLVLEAHDRPCPDGMECLHDWGGNQDNRWPENIRWGTHAENVADMVRHGKSARGERARDSKLTDAIVAECRQRRRQGEAVADLAREFGINESSMYGVVAGKAWRHVAGPVADAGVQRGSTHFRSKLTEPIVAEARRRAREGETATVLAQEAGVTVDTMAKAIRGFTWRHVPFPD